MKKLVIILFCTFLFSCTTTDPDRYINCVKSSFPNSMIYSFYGDRTTNTDFIVIDSTGVKYVETYGQNNVYISKVTMLEKIQ